MATIYNIPKAKFATLRLLAIHSGHLHVLAGPVSEDCLSKDQAIKKLGSVGVDPAESKAIVNEILSLHALGYARGLSADELFDDLTISLEHRADPTWKAENLGIWKLSADAIKSVLRETSPLRILAKADRLTFDRSDIFFDAKILTDFRPVFDDRGESIMELIITSTFVLETHSRRSGDDNSILKSYITLDREDIVQIIDECSRALKKIDTSKEKLAKVGIKPLVVGEESDSA